MLYYIQKIKLIKVASGEYDSAFCAESLRTFMWECGKPLNFDPSHFPRTQDLPPIYGETSIAYVFSKESFLKHNRRLGSKPYIKEVGKIEAIDIDYFEDFAEYIKNNDYVVNKIPGVHKQINCMPRKH